jgi:hypothetical protein
MLVLHFTCWERPPQARHSASYLNMPCFCAVAEAERVEH